MTSRLAKVFAFLLLLGCAAWAQTTSDSLSNSTMPAVIMVPPEAQASPSFNAETATKAYLAQIPASAKARSDAYFEGGYWLILWDFLYGAVICLVLLNLRWSAAMRNFAERITRFKPIQNRHRDRCVAGQKTAKARHAGRAGQLFDADRLELTLLPGARIGAHSTVLGDGSAAGR